MRSIIDRLPPAVRPAQPGLPLRIKNTPIAEVSRRREGI
jgi:hypothetical protein